VIFTAVKHIMPTKYFVKLIDVLAYFLHSVRVGWRYVFRKCSP